MKNLKQQLIRLGYQDPSLRKHLKPVLDALQSKTASQHQSHFQEAANDFAANHLTELDYEVQQDLMEAISKLHKGRKIPDPKGLLRKLMRERQNISGKAGMLLEEMIHALEDMAT